METESRKRRLTTILAADVVGYSKLIEKDDEGTVQNLNVYRGLFDNLIARHDGRMVGTAGDSIIAEFPSAVEAVRCAVEVLEELAIRNEELAEEEIIQFRIGISIGDVIAEGDDLFGHGVNVAARLEGLADPGGICISESAYEQVRNKLTVSFEDIGPQEFKNISQPVRAYRLVSPVGVINVPQRDLGISRRVRPGLVTSASFVAIAAAIILGSWYVFLRAPKSAEASIAVLPFTTSSNNENHKTFSDGLTVDLITNLSKQPGLFVIARHSVFKYPSKEWEKGFEKDVGSKLGVRYLVTGNVQKIGDRVRGTA